MKALLVGMIQTSNDAAPSSILARLFVVWIYGDILCCDMSLFYCILIMMDNWYSEQCDIWHGTKCNKSKNETERGVMGQNHRQTLH